MSFMCLHDIADSVIHCPSADKDKGDMPPHLIPRLGGSAGCKTTTDGGGRTHAGFNLCNKMGLSTQSRRSPDL